MSDFDIEIIPKTKIIKINQTDKNTKKNNKNKEDRKINKKVIK